MHRYLLIALLLFSAPAAGAPTCLNHKGETARCGAAGSMPFGWKPSPQQQWEWDLARPPGPPASYVIKVILGVAVFLAMIALLPRFDGTRGWDRQEGDDDNQGPFRG